MAPRVASEAAATLDPSMGTSVDRPATRVDPGFEFVPARWLVVAFAVARLVLRRGKPVVLYFYPKDDTLTTI